MRTALDHQHPVEIINIITFVAHWCSKVVFSTSQHLRTFWSTVPDIPFGICRKGAKEMCKHLYVSVFLSEPPKISSSLRREELMVVVNGVLELECIADGVPPPTVSWMKDGHPLEDSRAVLHREGQILTIRNMKVLTNSAC